MISVFEKSCNDGDGFSCLLAGVWFSDGKDTLPNDEKAVAFFEKGANLNDFESCCNLGSRYANGKGVEQNNDKAKLYYQKACNAGWKCGCESLEELLSISSDFENKILKKCGSSTIECTHHDSQIVFVDRIGSLIYSGSREYDDPKLGVSVAYNATGISSTIYVYDLGIDNISNEPFSDNVADQFHQASNDVMRIHENASRLDMDIIDLGNNKFILHESIEFIEENIKKHSHIFVWGYNSNFIKIRFTYDADKKEESLKTLDNQLLYMSQYVSESTLTDDKGLEFHARKDQKLAYMIWRYLAERGDGVSQYFLGMLFHEIKDIKNAIYWLNQASSQGIAEAQNNLGFLYENGLGVEKNIHTALSWYEKSAAQGLLEAYHGVADVYMNEENDIHDYKKAFSYYEKAANQGFSPSQYELGKIYCYGYGIPKDLNKGAYWIKQAKDNGYDVSELWNEFLLEKYLEEDQ